MIYDSCNREFWRGSRTSLKFLSTAAITGIPALILGSIAAALFNPDITVGAVFDVYAADLARLLAVLTGLKLVSEATIFRHLLDHTLSPLKRSALLLKNDLSAATTARFALGVFGGIFLPIIIVSIQQTASDLSLIILAVLSFTACLAGELAERYLFFSAVVRDRMPGGVAS